MTLTADQMALRKGKITASMMGAVLGVNPYASRVDAYDSTLWMTTKPNQLMERGCILESAVCEIFRAEHPEFDQEQGKTVIHPSEEWLVATPDRWLIQSGERVGLAEIKCVSPNGAASWASGLPVWIEAQVRTQLAVCDLPFCWVAAFFTIADVRFYLVERNADIEAAIMTIARAFYENHIHPRIRPDSDDRAEPPSPIITPHKGRVRTVEAGSGADLLGIEAVELSDQKQFHQAEIKRIDQRLDAIKAELVPELGDAEVLQGNGWALKAAHVKGRINWEQVALETCEDGERLSEAKLKHTGPGTVRLTLKGLTR